MRTSGQRRQWDAAQSFAANWPFRSAISVAAILSFGLLGVSDHGVPVFAQDEWKETESPSGRFLVLSADADMEARELVASVDELHDGLSALFGGRLPGPVTIKIHKSRKAYLAANPLVATVGEIDAGTRRPRREIDVYERHDALIASRSALERDVRYEMAHLFIARQSGGRMSPGAQEGLARYLSDRPTAEADRGQGVVAGVARLRDARRKAALKTWDELSSAGAAYLDPEIAQPQSLSMIHFLVETEGLDAVLDLVEASADAEGWRDAFDAAFQRPPDTLEASFREWLPGYLDGGWRHHDLYVDGVDRAERLIREGRYEIARDRLMATVALLDREDPAGAARARLLIARAERGLSDAEDLGTALRALEDGAYGVAEAAANVVLAGGDDAAQTDAARITAAEIRERARLGIESDRALESAGSQDILSAPFERKAANTAVRGFSLLGDELKADRARAIYLRSGSAIGYLGWALIVAGSIVLIRNGFVRRAVPRSGEGRQDSIDSRVRSPRILR